MRILLINKFFYPRGGSESSFFDTARLLRQYGHPIQFFSMSHPDNLPSEYERYFVSRKDYDKPGIKNKLFSSLSLIYSFEARKNLGRLLKNGRPDIAHLHNIYHQISPSILHTLKKRKIPVVMSLHDFKLVCPAYLLLRGGKACEECAGKRFYRCLLNSCAAGSRIKSLLSSVEMYLHHHILRIYELVDIFISPSMFLKSKIEKMGFKGRIAYLPNFIMPEKPSPASPGEQNSIVYFGRLSQEKGLLTLLDAMKKITGASLKIIGDGPVRKALEEKAVSEGIKNIFFLGRKSGEDLKNEVKSSMFSVFPSQACENNPRAIIESLAMGKPVIGTNIGGIPELIRENETGLLFKTNDPQDLAAKILHLMNNPEKTAELGRNARGFAERELNPENYYNKLIEIYEEAISINNECHYE